MGARIELASLYESRLQDGLRELHQRDYRKYAAVWEWLDHASDPGVRQAKEYITPDSQTAA